ncbi:MAG TPA: cbb3-type cytochrome c oxidase subunit I [Vitreimonas sp.]|uniref:cbb3-type cytochrome c oxidase subunit I n=1 Tax=Vitreimonas sp. TaxID=3069702 RepID=UPI002D748182|nr:cbb3-type cytochrome c oxidase subunit I [Vitreimonas sp.]HYD87178.1 cbb3-type cytochrome c oxidase subunit I [Vitreimonas sp.]
MRSETGFDPDLYKRFPTKEERPAEEVEELKRIWCAPKGLEYLTAVNNNYVGIYYVGGAFLFFILAGVLALLMRTQLALPLNGFLDEETYNQIFTMHGSVMMFLFAVPAVEALGILLLPQMLAARDLPFPRLSAYAFWAYFIGGLAFFCSLFFGLAPSGGWFMYPPLTSSAYSPGINADFWLLGIGFIEISAIAGAIEIIVGVLKTRAPGMSLDKLPVFAWSMLVFAAMIVIGFPSIILCTLLLELERALNWPFFDALRGGDPLLWQHLFWFFGHPDVYIIFLPAAGITSMIIPTVAQRPLVGHNLVVLAIIATGFISFGVWVHHMFTTGLPAISTSFFSAASMAVSVPAGLQVFAWIATLAAGKIRWTAPAYFAIGGLVVFVMGGLTGVMLAMVPFDWVTHDTYFVVAHFHYVLIGGMVFPLLAGFYYWAPMMSKRRLSERLGKVAFWLIFVGMHVTFLVMHLTGLMGMPRRVWTYPDIGWTLPNQISTIGSFMIGAGVLVIVIDLVRNFRFSTGEGAGNVYNAGTLEWLPTELYSTRSIPVIKSRYPLWDDSNLSKDVEDGRYFLPNSATGERETIVTSPINAEPQYLQRMPGPSWFHFGAALFTAGFFLLLTVKLYALAVLNGLAAIVCIVRWVWANDLPMKQASADIGAGIRVPTYSSGPRSHSWWAMIVLLTVTGMIFAMMCFSYIFIWSSQAAHWPAPPPLSALWACGALASVALGCAVFGVRLYRSTPVGAMALVGVAVIALAAELWISTASWRGGGLTPELNSHDALIAMFLAWDMVFATISTLMALYLVARWWAGLLVRERPATMESVGLFTAYAAAQALLALLLTRAFPLAV